MTKEEAIAFGKRVIDLGFKDETAEFCEMAISALSENKTQMIDKSNFDAEQYKTDLQSAYDCGYNKALSENKGEWIPVSEKLPKPYELVIRTVKSIGWNGTSHIYVDLGTICPVDTDVIAWQPLPEPYKGVSE